MAGELILVVEDNEKNRKLERDILQFHGYRTVEADTAEEGIRLAQATPPALVLMDIQLPGRDPGDRGDGLGDDPGPPEDHGGRVRRLPAEADRGHPVRCSGAYRGWSPRTGKSSVTLTRPLRSHTGGSGDRMIDRRTGWRQEAQEQLTTATTMYREMGMRFWLEQAEAGRDT